VLLLTVVQQFTIAQVHRDGRLATGLAVVAVVVGWVFNGRRVGAKAYKEIENKTNFST
jgi:hypothetical protein